MALDKPAPHYYGIQKKAITSWVKLSEKLDEVQTYPCADKPEAYIDNDPPSDDDCELLCAGCPALRECYKFALDNDEEYGVWGGINFTNIGLERRGELF